MIYLTKKLLERAKREKTKKADLDMVRENGLRIDSFSKESQSIRLIATAVSQNGCAVMHIKDSALKSEFKKILKWDF